ncbi:MAG: NAD(P)H-dependent oxidoreductase [Bacteroidota bacterium]
MKSILVINGHPDPESYNYALSASYVDGLQQAGFTASQINITELDFSPSLAYGYRKDSPMEPDLEKALNLIKAADHLVWFFPMWWYGYPAIMKGFIDRVFLPGHAFEYQKGNPLPKKLFKGKSARLVITADSPAWYNKLFMGSPAIKQLKRGTLQFTGINPVRVTYIAPIRGSSEAFRKNWLKKLRLLGEKGK